MTRWATFILLRIHALARKAKNQTSLRSSQQQTKQTQLFSLGQLVATPGALAPLEKAGQSPAEFLARHVQGDWGELGEEHHHENRLALQRGFRLLSSDRTPALDTKLWVITETDRSVTTLLLPEEY
jgi:hypothetical protein